MTEKVDQLNKGNTAAQEKKTYSLMDLPNEERVTSDQTVAKTKTTAQKSKKEYPYENMNVLTKWLYDRDLYAEEKSSKLTPQQIRDEMTKSIEEEVIEAAKNPEVPKLNFWGEWFFDVR